MRDNKKILWITHTAAAIALLIVVQAATGVLGNTLVTGSCVNFLLIVSVIVCGFKTGIATAILSPVAARFIGIGPLWSLIPFIVLGNAALCCIWHGVLNGHSVKDKGTCMKAVVLASAAKFLVLYLGIVKLAIPLILHMPQKQASVISQMFSWPQLLTAAIGGGMAMMALPAICRAVGRDGKKG